MDLSAFDTSFLVFSFCGVGKVRSRLAENEDHHNKDDRVGEYDTSERSQEGAVVYEGVVRSQPASAVP